MRSADARSMTTLRAVERGAAQGRTVFGREHPAIGEDELAVEHGAGHELRPHDRAQLLRPADGCVRGRREDVALSPRAHAYRVEISGLVSDRLGDGTGQSHVPDRRPILAEPENVAVPVRAPGGLREATS